MNRRDELTAEQQAWYRKGWRYSSGPCVRGLEQGDAMGYPDAWYVGYLDAAVGRPMWSLRDDD